MPAHKFDNVCAAPQPLSDDAREKTATAFSEALKSVFVSSIKLAAFHALFTWLTFRYVLICPDA